MNNADITYQNLLTDVIQNGVSTNDRTGVGTRSVFGRQVRFDLTDNKIPLLTTKKVHWKAIVIELLWFIRGETNTSFLHKHGITIWDEWQGKNGELGPIYGHQWRKWGGDQLKKVIERIKTNPDCRRLIVNAWNADQIDQMALMPCHTMFQFKVYGDKLSCQLYQRSADIFLGVPFNIASYALLTHMVAKHCGLQAYEFIHTFGDLHLYNNHLEAAQLQLTRYPYNSPKIEINIDNPILFAENCDDLSWKEIEKAFQLVDYTSHPPIKASVAV
jgi:thymidylate synthase